MIDSLPTLLMAEETFKQSIIKLFNLLELLKYKGMTVMFTNYIYSKLDYNLLDLEQPNS